MLRERRGRSGQDAEEDHQGQVSRHMYMPLALLQQLDCQSWGAKTGGKSSHDDGADVIEVMQNVPIS